MALMFMEEDHTLPALTSFGINHGFLHDYTQILEPAQATVVKLGERRTSITTVILGEAVWCRQGERTWSLATSTHSTVWPWLYRVNCIRGVF